VVTPMQTAAVAAQVDGIIQHVAFQEGQEVSKGQVLFRIDPRPYQNAYDQVKATLARDSVAAANAQREVQRYVSLAEKDYVTKEQADQQRATAGSAAAVVQADRATLATARFNLENTVIRAPIAGKTGGLLVRTGNLVRTAGGSPLVVINQVRPILVRFAVPSSELQLVLEYGPRGGLPVSAVPGGARPSQGPTDSSAGPSMSLDAAAPIGAGPATQHAAGGAGIRGGLVETGTLSFVDNAVDTTTETVMLKATFPNTSGMLWAGQFASTTLELFDEKDALIIPAQCVVTGQRGTYVYVIDSTMTAQQRPVVVERTTGDIAIIGTGLTGGERVVTDGQSRLTPGATVMIRSPSGEGGTSASGGGRGGRGGRGRGRGTGPP
ncbi:MAG TPA: efflux RND transporter periplasmic adaptor subunit, partial [Mycobacterium sp.]|nr:efflux RND transporter periplasmic adaptor subunit [Mycobacterium sp.]